MLRNHERAGLALVVAGVLAACGSPQDGRVDVSLTTVRPAEIPVLPQPLFDAHLDVQVTELSVHVAPPQAEPQPPGMPPDQDGEGEWVILFSGEYNLDLLDAGKTSAFLGAEAVPPGRITQIRLQLAPDVTLTAGRMAFDVRCPSCEQTGIKVVTHGDLIVEEGQTLRLTLVFDLPASLRTGEDGKLVLDPVIRL